VLNTASSRGGPQKDVEDPRATLPGSLLREDIQWRTTPHHRSGVDHGREQTMAKGLIRYWAAARAAAGVTEEPYEAATLEEALRAAEAGRGGEFARVIARSSFLVDGAPVGTRDHATVELTDGATVEVLPPFAGG
jgi:sulfur-carrier protein